MLPGCQQREVSRWARQGAAVLTETEVVGSEPPVRAQTAGRCFLGWCRTQRGRGPEQHWTNGKWQPVFGGYCGVPTQLCFRSAHGMTGLNEMKILRYSLA